MDDPVKLEYEPREPRPKKSIPQLVAQGFGSAVYLGAGFLILVLAAPAFDPMIGQKHIGFAIGFGLVGLILLLQGLRLLVKIYRE